MADNDYRVPPQPWVRAAVNVCDTDLLKAIVADNRNPPSSGGSHLPNVQIVGAPRVQTPDVGPKYRAYQPPPEDTPADRSGWREQTPLRPPEGVNYVDALCDQQDLADFEARCREQAARMGISYPDWLKLMEKDLRDRRERKEKAAKDRKETPK
jgi:hypothetical protein